MIKRSRNWTFVGYPESLPDNYIDLLINLHTNVVISPLHDKDINADGEPKKAHYHFLVSFESDKSYNQILEITQLLNATVPQICQNVKGMVRYFIHFDNPEKFPYQKEDIRCLGYLDLEDYFKVSFTEKFIQVSDMLCFIRENNILEFCDFVDFCLNNRKQDWFPILSESNISNFISSYIRSRYYKSLK